jgi:hypothetical protein
MSTSIDPFVTLNTPVERRFYSRITPSAPIYVAFGPNNLGTLLNVSENGFQVVTPTRLDLNSVYRVFLSLDGASSTITVSVRTIWTADSQNCSGIQLLDLTEQDRQQIRKWVTLQTSQNENLEHWFSPNKSEPSVAAPEPPDAASPEPPPPLAPVPEPPSPPANQPQPKLTQSAIEPEFPPMPLPIHGEFTYQPPSEQEQKRLRRRERASRSRSRSPVTQFVLWTLFMATICGAAGWSFRHQLSERFLRRPTRIAKESATSVDNGKSSVATESTAQPTGETPSSLDVDTNVGDVNKDVASKDSKQDASPASVPRSPAAALTPAQPTVAATMHLAPKVSPSRPNLSSLPNRTIPPEAPEVQRSYLTDSVPVVPATNTARAPTPATVPVTTISSASAPATRTNSALPPPATIRTTLDAPTRRSAIVGSIDSSSRPSNSSSAAPSSATPSSTVASSAPPTYSQASTPRGNSFVARNPNSTNYAPSNPAPANPTAPNSTVIQMDVPEARAIEITPPKGLTKDLAASYVNLPGERVLRSGSLTVHIERSVRVPGDHIPGERWLWRGHKTVILGELASRVDPQVSQLPVPYGSITVLANIDKDGYVSNVKPLYGSLAFLPNVAAAIRSWRYQPTYLDNKPADTQAQIEIDFHPSGARTSRP